MTPPDLAAHPGNRWTARCACARENVPPGAAFNAASAWSILEALGWAIFVAVADAEAKALCKRCGVKDARILTDGSTESRRKAVEEEEADSEMSRSTSSGC